MKIFDNPNHNRYGPVRRMWVVLTQLDLITAAERWSDWQRQQGSFGGSWDMFLAGSMDANPAIPEAAHQRFLIGILLEGWA